MTYNILGLKPLTFNQKLASIPSHSVPSQPFKTCGTKERVKPYMYALNYIDAIQGFI